MTLDYTKMFLIVTEEAVVKGHFASAWADSQLVTMLFTYLLLRIPIRFCSPKREFFVGMPRRATRD